MSGGNSRGTGHPGNSLQPLVLSLEARADNIPTSRPTVTGPNPNPAPGAAGAFSMPAVDARMNHTPPEFNAARDLPDGFMEFYVPLHREFTPRQRSLMLARRDALAAAHEGHRPEHLPASDATTGEWRIDVPEWCRRSAQSDDRARRRRRAGGQDAQLGRSRA